MDTRTLIETLSSDARPARGPGLKATLAMVVGVSLAYCVAAIIAVRGLRPDFAAHVDWVAIKAGASLLFAACAVAAGVRLAQPGRRLGVTTSAALGLLVIAVVAAISSLVAAAPGTRVTALTGDDFPHCVPIISVLAAPAGAAMMLWFRRQAPTRLRLAGAAAGALAGGLAAMAYALVCPVDSIAFIATWYTLAILICAGIGALAGGRALRW